MSLYLTPCALLNRCTHASFPAPRPAEAPAPVAFDGLLACAQLGRLRILKLKSCAWSCLCHMGDACGPLSLGAGTLEALHLEEVHGLKDEHFGPLGALTAMTSLTVNEPLNHELSHATLQVRRPRGVACVLHTRSVAHSMPQRIQPLLAARRVFMLLKWACNTQYVTPSGHNVTALGFPAPPAAPDTPQRPVLTALELPRTILVLFLNDAFPFPAAPDAPQRAAIPALELRRGAGPAARPAGPGGAAASGRPQPHAQRLPPPAPLARAGHGKGHGAPRPGGGVGPSPTGARPGSKPSSLGQSPGGREYAGLIHFKV